MDIAKIKAAIAVANEELNGVIDGEFKARRLKGLNRLNNAANALKLAETHLDAAVKQGEAKAATTPATPKAAGKK